MVRGWPDSWRPSSLFGQFQGSNDLVNQRLVGEVHLDEFDVSHTKDRILWRDSQEEEDVEEELRKVCNEYKEIAKRPRKEGEDQRGPTELEVKAALDELQKEMASPEMVDQINITVIPAKETIEANNDKIVSSVVQTRSATLHGTIASNPPIAWEIFLDVMSPNDPYVAAETTQPSKIIVVVNKNHPYWAQLSGTESVRDYLRQCVYDAVAEWQARTKAATIDYDTVKLLKDQLLRLPLQMESHADGPTDPATGATSTVH